MLLVPIHSDGQVLPGVLLAALLFGLEVEVVFAILKLHSVIVNTPLERLIEDVRGNLR